MSLSATSGTASVFPDPDDAPGLRDPAAPHYTGIATRDPGEFMAELDALRWRKLQRQLAWCFERSPFYRRKLQQAGVAAPQDLDSLDAFRRLPALITKTEHRQIQQDSLDADGHPFGTHLCARLQDVIHVAGTSGSTGHPTFYTFTRRDLATTLRVFGRMWARIGLQPGETVFHANGLSLWLGGVTAVMSFEAYGARPIPIGAEAGVARILQYLRLTRPTSIILTPSLANHLIDRAPDEIGMPVAALGLKRLIVGGEPGAGLPAMRAHLRAAWGARVHDLTGGAWHNGTICSGGAGYHGMHLMGEDVCFRYDLRDPETHAPLPLVDGAVGEAIHTGLEYEAGPALRYATGDIVRLHVGTDPDDGFFGARIEILGRADDLLMVKGIKVYPASIKEVVEGFRPDVSGELRIELDAPPPRVAPPLRLTVEAGRGFDSAQWPALAARIADRMSAVLSVRPVIEVVAHETLPRTGGKTALIRVREAGAAG